MLLPAQDSPLVFKVCAAAEWREAAATGVYGGSAVDRRDGFIHLSPAQQLAETLRRHFAGQRDLVLIAFEPDQLGEGLRWEPSRGGALFPHVYGELPVRLGQVIARLEVDDGGDVRAIAG